MKRPILKLPEPAANRPPELLEKSALVVPITFEEAEGIVKGDLANASTSENWARDVREGWEDLQAKMLPGDQLWTYQTGTSWIEDGLALMRKRKIIAKLMLRRRHEIRYERMPPFNDQ